MNKKILSLAILISTSPVVMAENFYQPPPTDNHHEVTAGGIGLLAGTIAAGPLGAIIGGSLGVMTGHHQTQANTIDEQQQSITVLETELSQLMSALSQSKQSVQQLESTQTNIEQQHIVNLTKFADGYQLDIYFPTKESTLHPQAQQGLEKLVQLLQHYPTLQANIEAHSDWRGTKDENCLLAKQRLDIVTDYLTEAGTKQEQLLTTNYGEHNAYNNTSWGEELFYDRRVTISLYYFE
ncbi:MAG: hypothetical protein COB23_05615 [Methylophaga sp.]|nr:MAG: hypothetical protein COB23_05615 [Methylophaga sp.]